MNVLLVEDSIMIRAHMTSVLANIAGVRVVGHAGSEDEAVDLIKSVQPDVILMDFSLEVGNGINVLRRVRTAGCTSRVMMLSNNMTEHLRALSIELGAHRYFDKGRELDKAIEQIKDWLACPNVASGACGHLVVKPCHECAERHANHEHPYLV
jgi:two-component system invasion response regulator UvrY